MDILELQAIVIDALEDIKAQDIKLFDTVPLTSLFDRVAVVSGTSNRQTRALAAHVRDKVKAAGGQVISVEGEETGEWVLVDLGDMVVHVMQPAIRAYYNLEELWGEYPIDFKTAKKKPVSRRTASSSVEEETAATAIKKPRTVARKAKPTRAEAAEDSALTPISKSAAKTLAWRAAADKYGKGENKPAAKKPAAKKPATSKSTPSKTAAGKTPTARTSAVKAPAKKVAAKK
jgi:ribosome-associated protein